MEVRSQIIPQRKISVRAVRGKNQLEQTPIPFFHILPTRKDKLDESITPQNPQYVGPLNKSIRHRPRFHLQLQTHALRKQHFKRDLGEKEKETYVTVVSAPNDTLVSAALLLM